jgi:hypothetical protein
MHPPVTVDLLGAASVQTGQLLAGSVTADRLAPKQPDNIIEDPSFEQVHTRANPQGGEFDNTVSDHGDWSLKFVANGTVKEYRPATMYVPCAEDDKVLIILRYRHTGSISDGLDVSLEYDGAATDVGGPTAVADGAWRTYVSTRTVPAGAKGLRLLLSIDDAAGSAWVDQVDVRILRVWKTDDTGARAELDFDGFRLYDASDDLMVDLNANTGDALFKGTITGGSISILDEAANNTTLRLEDLLGLHWVDTARDVRITKVNTGLVDDSGKYQTLTEMNTEVEAGDTYAATTNPRKARVYTYQKHDKSASKHEAEVLMAAARGGATSMTTWIRIFDNLKTPTTTFTNGSCIELTRAGTGSEDGKLQISLVPQGNGSNSRYSAGSWDWEDVILSNVTSSGTGIAFLASVVVPVISGRRYRVVLKVSRWASSASGDIFTFMVDDGTGNTFDSWRRRHDGSANVGADGFTLEGMYVATSNANITFSWNFQRQTGSGNATVVGSSAADRSWMYVEDIGF